MKKQIISLLLVVALTGGCSGLFADETLKNSKGKDIILHDNFTWEFKNAGANTGDPASATLILTKSPEMKSVFKSSSGKYSIYFDPIIWKQTKDANAAAEINFSNKDNTGFAMAIYDGLNIPLEKMQAILISNAHNIDPNAHIVDSQPAMVNGTPAVVVTYAAESENLKFIFYSLVVAGDKGTIQFTFYTLDSAFDNLKPIFAKAMAGFVY